mgnify:CR=1 FL=1
MKKCLLCLVLISITLLSIVGCKKESEVEYYKISFEGSDITPGQKINLDKIKKGYDKSEVTDCAFGEKGIVYTFEDLEISTNEDGLIYSVYFISSNMKTTEGVSLGDEKSKINKNYSECVEDDETLKCSKGRVEIDFNINNDSISGIRYILLD